MDPVGDRLPAYFFGRLFRSCLTLSGSSFLLYPSAVSGGWIFALYDPPNQQCSNDEGISVQEGTVPSSCRTTGGTPLNGLYWDSGGPSDQTNSYFVCMYNDSNCNNAIATFPEGSTGCITSDFPSTWASWQVFSSDSQGC